MFYMFTTMLMGIVEHYIKETIQRSMMIQVKEDLLKSVI